MKMTKFYAEKTKICQNHGGICYYPPEGRTFLRTLRIQRSSVHKRGCKFDKMVCKFDKMGCKILKLFHFTQNTFLIHSNDSKIDARKYWVLIRD